MSEAAKVTIELTAFGSGDQRPEYPLIPVELTDEQRAATLNLVRGAMIDLLQNLDEWVPESFVAQSKSRLDVLVSFDMIDVDNAVLHRHLQAERALADARAELLAMRESLDD